MQSGNNPFGFLDRVKGYKADPAQGFTMLEPNWGKQASTTPESGYGVPNQSQNPSTSSQVPQQKNPLVFTGTSRKKDVLSDLGYVSPDEQAAASQNSTPTNASSQQNQTAIGTSLGNAGIHGGFHYLGSGSSSAAPATTTASTGMESVAAANAAPQMTPMAGNAALAAAEGSGFIGTAGPAAAAIASAIGGGRGMYEGYQNYQRGHGRQQQGITEAANSMFTPTSGFNRILGEPVSSRDLNNILAMSNPVTAPLGIANTLGINFFGGKHPEQVRRDTQIREPLQQMGLLDQDFALKLPDGSTYNLGQENDPTGRRVYEADFSRPETGYIAGLANPLAYILTKGDEFAATQLASMLTNASMSNTNDYMQMRQNLLSMYHQAGLKPSQVITALTQLRDEGALSQEKYDAMVNGVNTLRRGGQVDIRQNTPAPAQTQQQGANTPRLQTIGEVTGRAK